MKLSLTLSEAKLEKLARAHYESYAKSMIALTGARGMQPIPWEGLTEDLRKAGISAMKVALGELKYAFVTGGTG